MGSIHPALQPTVRPFGCRSGGVPLADLEISGLHGEGPAQLRRDPGDLFPCRRPFMNCCCGSGGFDLNQIRDAGFGKMEMIYVALAYIGLVCQEGWFPR